MAATPPTAASHGGSVSKPNHLKKTPTSSSYSATAITCSLPKQVFLHDWWLIKSDISSNSKQLGIAGFNSKEGQGLRVFRSAPIVIRHDTVTLETLDDITVTISGVINRSRTLQNGFPSEICNHFLFGFPYYWEEFAAEEFGEDVTKGVVPQPAKSLDETNANKLNGCLPVSCEDLPATAIRDLLLMSTLEDYERSMRPSFKSDTILKDFVVNTCIEGETSDFLNEYPSQRNMTDSTLSNQNQENTTKADQKQKSDHTMSEATPSFQKRRKKEQKKKGDKATAADARNNKKGRVGEKHEGDDATSDASAIKCEASKSEKNNGDIVDHVPETTPIKYRKSKDKQKNKTDHAESPATYEIEANCSTTRRCTRSVTCSQSLRNRQEENLLCNNSIKSEVKVLVSASEEPWKQCQHLANRCKVSKLGPRSTFVEEIEEAKKSPKGSALRRSSRLQGRQAS